MLLIQTVLFSSTISIERKSWEQSLFNRLNNIGHRRKWFAIQLYTNKIFCCYLHKQRVKLSTCANSITYCCIKNEFTATAAAVDKRRSDSSIAAIDNRETNGVWRWSNVINSINQSVKKSFLFCLLFGWFQSNLVLVWKSIWINY